MPFTFSGEWISEDSKSSDLEEKKWERPVKVRLLKRGKNILTVILNLPISSEEKEMLASKIKKKLGCGGCVKEGTIEIQGDKVEAVKKILLDLGVKNS